MNERFAKLRKAREWSAGLLEALEADVRGASDEQLFRVNPKRWAAARGFPEREAIDLFLYAAWAGLFHIDWSLLCPACGDDVESFRTLANVNLHFRCTLCRTSNETNLDDFIHVSFTVAPLVRRIAFHDPLSLSAEDFYFKYHLAKGIIPWPGTSDVVEGLRRITKIMTYLPPHESKTYDIEIDPGYFDIACRRIEAALREPDMFVAPPKPAIQEQLFPESA